MRVNRDHERPRRSSILLHARTIGRATGSGLDSSGVLFPSRSGRLKWLPQEAPRGISSTYRATDIELATTAAAALDSTANRDWLGNAATAFRLPPAIPVFRGM